MKPTTMALAIATVIYTLSWFLPVVGAVPGWEALRLALSPILPYQGLTGDRSLLGLIGVFSALTNVWFAISLAVLVSFPRESDRAVFWGLVLAALVNTVWFLVSESRADLRVGYYLWLGSFLALAGAARLISQQVSGGPAGCRGRPNLAIDPTVSGVTPVGRAATGAPPGLR